MNRVLDKNVEVDKIFKSAESIKEIEISLINMLKNKVQRIYFTKNEVKKVKRKKI